MTQKGGPEEVKRKKGWEKGGPGHRFEESLSPGRERRAGEAGAGQGASRPERGYHPSKRGASGDVHRVGEKRSGGREARVERLGSGPDEGSIVSLVVALSRRGDVDRVCRRTGRSSATEAVGGGGEETGNGTGGGSGGGGCWSVSRSSSGGGGLPRPHSSGGETHWTGSSGGGCGRGGAFERTAIGCGVAGPS